MYLSKMSASTKNMTKKKKQMQLTSKWLLAGAFFGFPERLHTKSFAKARGVTASSKNVMHMKIALQSV